MSAKLITDPNILFEPIGLMLLDCPACQLRGKELRTWIAQAREMYGEGLMSGVGMLPALNSDGYTLWSYEEMKKYER